MGSGNDDGVGNWKTEENRGKEDEPAKGMRILILDGYGFVYVYWKSVLCLWFAQKALVSVPVAEPLILGDRWKLVYRRCVYHSTVDAGIVVVLVIARNGGVLFRF